MICRLTTGSVSASSRWACSLRSAHLSISGGSTSGSTGREGSSTSSCTDSNVQHKLVSHAAIYSSLQHPASIVVQAALADFPNLLPFTHPISGYRRRDVERLEPLLEYQVRWVAQAYTIALKHASMINLLRGTMISDTWHGEPHTCSDL